ncbi:MAG: VWA domain-containing protein [Sphaerochaetaceae bacterium]|nr:VWA domain-containing protein [Sphaerochaetaceae bacterium]MDX9809758.1 VWA domain-containing protein [Sphaerochaetaceae bacterium]
MINLFRNIRNFILMLFVCTALVFIGCGASSARSSISEQAVGYAPTAAAVASESYAMAAMAQEIEIVFTAPVDYNTEQYDRIEDNPFLFVQDNPVSTFSIDVDTASYSNVRRFLMTERSLPYKDAVRIEELLNYFTYDYPSPNGEEPVAVDFLMSTAPWNTDHWLLRIALKAEEIDTKDLPPSNLVLLLDTSGSMTDDNKLPLIQDSLKILAERLRPVDRISIVAYAGSSGLVLDSTPGDKRETIIQAFSQLEAGGSTAGEEGLLLAYSVAKKNFIPGGNNRVILCTDGDFNVGLSSVSELERLIEEKRKDNIYLTTVGVGMGNYKDDLMETLADKGNGNYAYVDNLLEGKKVFGKEIWGNLFTVAKDVKIQVEFNPAIIREYRLIGYENRMLAREDFNDDSKDAGEMGSGQTVTAFYELIPQTNQTPVQSNVDPLIFQQSTIIPSEDMMAFRLRYKDPSDGMPEQESKLISMMVNVSDIKQEFDTIHEDFRFATAVIEYGLLLRDSPFKSDSNWDSVIERARYAKGMDLDGYRSEFVMLAETAELLIGETL